MAYLDVANVRALCLLFGDWYIGADYAIQRFVILSDSEQTVLGFALCHPRINQMSLLTFSKIFVCVLPVMTINQIHIYIYVIVRKLEEKVCLLSLT